MFITFVPKLHKMRKEKDLHRIIGSNLLEARKEKGLSMQQVGEMIRISAVSVMRIEKGLQKLTLAQSMIICDKMGISIYDLIGYENIEESLKLPDNIIKAIDERVHYLFTQHTSS